MTRDQAVMEAAKKWCLAMNGLHGEFLLAQHQLLKAVEALILAAPPASVEHHWCIISDGPGRCASVSPDGKHRCNFGSDHAFDYHCCYPVRWSYATDPPTVGRDLPPTTEADLFTPAERAAQEGVTAVESHYGAVSTCIDDDCPLPEHAGPCPDDRTLEMWRAEAQRVRRLFGQTSEELRRQMRYVAGLSAANERLRNEAPSRADQAAWLTTADAILSDRQIAYDGQLTAEKFARLMAEYAPPSRAGQVERGALERVRDWLAAEAEEADGGQAYTRGWEGCAAKARDRIDDELSALLASPSREAEAELLAAAKAALRELHLCRSQSVVVGALEAAIAKAGGA